MLDTFKSLPEDPTELRAVSKLMAAEIQSQAYQIEKLKGQLAGHQKARFGSKSETLDQLIFDLAEDTEIEAAAQEQKAEQHSEPPRVYWRVKLSKDGPYDTKKTYPDLHG